MPGEALPRQRRARLEYGSGVVPITTMIRSGFAFAVFGALLIILGLPLLVARTGIGG